MDGGCGQVRKSTLFMLVMLPANPIQGTYASLNMTLVAFNKCKTIKRNRVWQFFKQKS